MQCVAATRSTLWKPKCITPIQSREYVQASLAQHRDNRHQRYLTFGNGQFHVSRLARTCIAASTLAQSVWPEVVKEQQKKEGKKKTGKKKKGKKATSENRSQDQFPYETNHKVMIVGDEDFSFSAAFMKRMHTSTRVFIFHPNSEASLSEKPDVMENIEVCMERQVEEVMYNADITALTKCFEKRFHRVIFLWNPNGGQSSEAIQALLAGFIPATWPLLSKTGRLHLVAPALSQDHLPDFHGLAETIGFELRPSEPFSLADAPKKRRNTAIEQSQQPDVNDGKASEHDFVRLQAHRVVGSKERKPKGDVPYECSQAVLVVGDDDLAFSAALATKTGFGQHKRAEFGANLIAVHPDSWKSLSTNDDVLKNIHTCSKAGVRVDYSVDLAKLTKQIFFKHAFNRIIFTLKQSSDLWNHENKELLETIVPSLRMLLTKKGQFHIAVQAKTPENVQEVEELAATFGFEPVPFQKSVRPYSLQECTGDIDRATVEDGTVENAQAPSTETHAEHDVEDGPVEDAQAPSTETHAEQEVIHTIAFRPMSNWKPKALPG